MPRGQTSFNLLDRMVKRDALVTNPGFNLVVSAPEQGKARFLEKVCSWTGENEKQLGDILWQERTIHICLPKEEAKEFAKDLEKLGATVSLKEASHSPRQTQRTFSALLNTNPSNYFSRHLSKAAKEEVICDLSKKWSKYLSTYSRFVSSGEIKTAIELQTPIQIDNNLSLDELKEIKQSGYDQGIIIDSRLNHNRR